MGTLHFMHKRRFQPFRATIKSKIKSDIIPSLAGNRIPRAEYKFSAQLFEILVRCPRGGCSDCNP